MNAETFLSLMPSRAPDRRINTARVETTTLLPGGGVANPRIERRAESWRVDDAGLGRETLFELGVFDLGGADTKRANSIADRCGLAFDGQTFFTDGISDDQLPAAIAYVAEAARAWVQETLDARAQRRRVQSTEAIQHRLHALLPGLKIDRDREILGVSTEAHAFDLVVRLPGERLALFESLTPNINAIASAYTKFDDVRRAHEDWPREAVVDSMKDWPAARLAMLQNVASHIRDLEDDWSGLPAQLAA